MSSKQHVASTILWTPSKGGIVTSVELRIHCIHFYISAFLSLYVLDFHHTAYIFSHSLSFSLFKSLSRRHVNHSLSCTTTYYPLPNKRTTPNKSTTPPSGKFFKNVPTQINVPPTRWLSFQKKRTHPNKHTCRPTVDFPGNTYYLLVVGVS